MLKLVLSLILIIAFVNSKGQDASSYRPVNNVAINAFGDASIVSVQYERLFLNSSKFFVLAKLGLGYNRQSDACWEGGCPEMPVTRYLTVPHHLTGNVGKGRSYFEFGIGGTSFVGGSDDGYHQRQSYMAYPMLGYRFFPTDSRKISFRVFGYFPITDADDVDILFVPIGLNLGFAF